MILTELPTLMGMGLCKFKLAYTEQYSIIGGMKWNAAFLPRILTQCWQNGRQNTGYLRLKLLQFACFDAYLLRYPVGSRIPAHVDPVTARLHYRFNVELKAARRGGQLLCERPIFRWGRVILFRSDLSLHEVTEILDGERWTLSLGAAPRKDNRLLRAKFAGTKKAG